MHSWCQRLAQLLQREPVVVVTLLAVTGSAPREPGARMLVATAELEGTIGGGVLEFQEVARARALIEQSMAGQLGAWHRETHRIILGPDVGQCCGGAVEVLHEVLGVGERAVVDGIVQDPVAGQSTESRVERPETAGVAWSVISADTRPLRVHSGPTAVRWVRDPVTDPTSPLYLYGAGHVGRELVRVLSGLPFAITWIDMARERFPDAIAAAVTPVFTDDPAWIAQQAAAPTYHLVMTHSHAVDEAICAAVLQRDAFQFLGLIGSQTKRARFIQRFNRMGINDAAIARLTCPIGIAGISSKHPAAIAVAVAAQLLHVATKP